MKGGQGAGDKGLFFHRLRTFFRGGSPGEGSGYGSLIRLAARQPRGGQASQRLKGLKPPALDSALKELVQGSQPVGKERLWDILKEIGYVEEWQRLLEGPDPARKIEALEIMGLVAVPRTLPLLMEAMADKHEGVRMGAAEALGHLKDPVTAEALVRALEKPEVWLPARVAQALMDLGEEGVEAMASALTYASPPVKAFIAEILGELRDPGGFDALVGALQDDDPKVRWKAAEALGRYQDGRGREPLEAALGDEEPLVRAQAAKALGCLGAGEARGLLEKLLADPEELVRNFAEEALHRLGHRE